MRRLLDLSADGIVVTTAGPGGHHPIIYVNPAFERMSGYCAAEVIGRDPRFLNHDLRDQPALQTLRQSLACAKDCEVTLRNHRKDGRAFWNQMRIAPVVAAGGEPAYFVAFMRDISDQLAADEASLNHQRRASQFEQLSIRDPLTGLHNRRYLHEQLERLWGTHQRLGERLALALIDIDAFKRFNDLYGHVRGDEALQQVASALSAHFKRDNDVLVRYGGEEFVVVTSLVADTQPFERHLEQTRASIEALGIQHEGARQGRRLTASIGFASVVPGNMVTPRDLLHAADLAMYAAKAQGGNQVKTANL